MIIQCDQEMSIIDVCRKVARERNARTVLGFAPKTSHQSNGFVEALHRHIQGFARCYQTHVNTNSIAMCETLPNNADCDCFKTTNLQEILRIQNLHQAEHCAFLEVIHLFQSVGCARNKLQFRTVQQNQKSFLWTQD